jgi:long-subunit fatty acid transport protein
MSGNKRRLGLFSIFVLFVMIMLPESIQAQMIEFGSSPNPVGSGARATGMGGAFISVADDATAASWNPAGLVQIEKPEFSVVYSHFSRSQRYHSSSEPGLDGVGSSVTVDSLNYASIVYPFVLFNRNFVVSLNYQRLFDMDKSYAFNRFEDQGDGITLSETYDFRQKGFLYALSPAMAVQIMPGLYLGATLNYWGEVFGREGWSTTNKYFSRTVWGGITIDNNISMKSDVSFRGMNANFGLLWNVYGPWTIGAVYKKSFNAHLRKESVRSSSSVTSFNGVIVSESAQEIKRTKEGLRMRMPESYGLGVSFHPNDALTVALDIYRTNWFRHVVRDSDGNEWNPLSAKSISNDRLSDTRQVRLGVEYLFIKEKMVFPVRAGLFYDPEPQTGKVDDYYGVSIGTGFAGSRIAVDASYQYRFARHVTGDIGAVIDGTKMDAKQHTVNVSAIFYFR